MGKMIQCIKLGREAEGLEKPPIKGPLGQRVFENVSKEAWKMWLEHSKILINEYRLDLMSESGQRIWMTELSVTCPVSATTAPWGFRGSPPGAGMVGRTMHHANHPTVVTGDPLPGRLTSSRGIR